MSRTERDVMRARRVKIWQHVAAAYPTEPQDETLWTRARDTAYKKALRIAGVYDHWCSPYCLLHGAKRHDRRRARQRAKQLLRARRWELLSVDFGKRRSA